MTQNLNVDIPAPMLWRVGVDFDAQVDLKLGTAEGVFVVMLDGERKSLTRVGLGTEHSPMTAHALTLFACLSALSDGDKDLAPLTHLVISCGHKSTSDWLSKDRFKPSPAGQPVALERLQGQLSELLATFGRVTAFFRPVEAAAAVCVA